MDIPDPKYDHEKPQHRTTGPMSHYYGGQVRVLFLVAGLVQLLALPYVEEIISIPILVSTVAILLIVFFAGLTNPKQKWVALLNLIASVAGLLVFEYFAVITFDTSGVVSFFFWINQVLALLFFFALYYSSKTLRGMYLN